jgi:hypothetical protein
LTERGGLAHLAYYIEEKKRRGVPQGTPLLFAISVIGRKEKIIMQ